MFIGGFNLMRSPLLEKILERIRPDQRKRLRRLVRPAWLGTIRRTTPLSERHGYDRGTPVDRYYIERFLEEHRRDIRGRALEIKDSVYTDRFGADVDRRDVLDIDAANRRATIVGDLAAADGIAADQFDCFVLTQTLQFIYNVRAAIVHAHRVLRPHGVLLVTVPAAGRMSPEDKPSLDYWRFTATSCSSLFGEVFGAERITVRSYGNVLTAIAFLTGMAYEELSRRELDANDENFPVILGVRAIKR